MGIRDGELRVVIHILQRAVSLPSDILPGSPGRENARCRALTPLPGTTRPAQASPRSGPSPRGGGGQASPVAGTSPLYPFTLWRHYHQVLETGIRANCPQGAAQGSRHQVRSSHRIKELPGHVKLRDRRWHRVRCLLGGLGLRLQVRMYSFTRWEWGFSLADEWPVPIF